MGVNYSTNVVRSGLVLHLDAANTKSYPGSGTAWTNMSGSGNNGTLTNGPIFNSDNKGSISTDGTNSYISLPINFFSHAATNPFSCSLWFSSTQTTGGTIFGQQSSANPSSSPNGWVPVIYLMSDGRIRSEPFWTGAISNTIISTSSFNNGSWTNVVITFNSGTHQMYINSAYIGQRTGLNQTFYSSTYYYFVGAGHSAGRSLGTHFFNGKVSNFTFYNRALFASEVSQNFNALRGRYGL